MLVSSIVRGKRRSSSIKLTGSGSTQCSNPGRIKVKDLAHQAAYCILRHSRVQVAYYSGEKDLDDKPLGDLSRVSELWREGDGSPPMRLPKQRLDPPSNQGIQEVDGIRGQDQPRD